MIWLICVLLHAINSVHLFVVVCSMLLETKWSGGISVDANMPMCIRSEMTSEILWLILNIVWHWAVSQAIRPVLHLIIIKRKYNKWALTHFMQLSWDVTQTSKAKRRYIHQNVLIYNTQCLQNFCLSDIFQFCVSSFIKWAFFSMQWWLFRMAREYCSPLWSMWAPES